MYDYNLNVGRTQDTGHSASKRHLWASPCEKSEEKCERQKVKCSCLNMKENKATGHKNKHSLYKWGPCEKCISRILSPFSRNNYFA